MSISSLILTAPLMDSACPEDKPSIIDLSTDLEKIY